MSTTIKRKYLDPIRLGEKKIERKVANAYWDPRLKRAQETLNNGGRVSITFVCGQEVDRYQVNMIMHRKSLVAFEVDMKLTHEWWEIYIGDEIV